jgi:hypothetical protein
MLNQLILHKRDASFFHSRIVVTTLKDVKRSKITYERNDSFSAIRDIWFLSVALVASELS